jgi:uncharacterized protein YsxB (DUF464 family)
MIKVKIEKSEDGKTLILTLEGHAGQAEIGQDIVCSAASILAYTTAQMVQTMREEGKLKKKPHIRLESGDAVITCKPSKGYFAEAMHIYSFAQTGYALLESNYPEYLSLVRLKA